VPSTHKPSIVKYQNGLLQIDLNGFEKVKAVSVGEIREFKIEGNKMLVRIGL
jgi:hypothetical protein